jgi:hypothetical protein
VIGSCRPTQSTRNWRLLPDIFDCDGARRRSVASEERRAESCVSRRRWVLVSKVPSAGAANGQESYGIAVAGMTLPTEFLLGVVCC